MKALSDATVVNFVSHEPSLEEIFLTFYRGSQSLRAGETGSNARPA
jgi:phosphohistidine phosphatase SixA